MRSRKIKNYDYIKPIFIILLLFIAGIALGTTDEHFDKARAFISSGQYIEAVDEFKIIISLERDGSEFEQNARYWIGQCYFRMKMFDEALSVFESLIADYPKSAIVPVARLMVSQTKQEKAKQRAEDESDLDIDVIDDQKTGVKYTRTNQIIGKSDIIKYTSAGFSLSPDARFLLWEAQVIPLDVGEPFKLVDFPAYRGYWSPDMKKIAFCSSGKTWVIHVSPETGMPMGEAQKVLDFHAQVTWSPDSEELAFFGEGICSVSIKDGRRRQVAHDPFPTAGCDWAYNLKWSHDGKTFAFSAYSNGRWNLWRCWSCGISPKEMGETSPDPEIRDNVRNRLTSTAEWLPNLTADQQGAGMVDQKLL
ncbi:MAG: tetratricopeptide repeat protein [bacterium]